MAVSTVDEYLSALEKSKLLGSEQFVAAQRLAGESSDAPELARALARENLVSRWQAGTLLALGQRAQLRLGKYKLIQRLGKGGMGTVFLAEHVTMNRRVALKIVPRSIAEDRASLDRFFAEASAIAALDHPNIVQAYSVDNEMDRYFIVMEFVDGQDLQRLVELNGPMAFDQAADYVRQAAEGLAHAHARNLVHCDIKPSNLLVNNRGVIKILDLGLARLNRSDEPRGAAAGEPAFGTVDYMAPEQALETANFDHRADIYCLGGTLYFLLTGHPPFPEGTLAQRIVKHQTQEPRDILLGRPDAPPKLVEICKRMMAKEPESRYQSMQEVSAALVPWQRKADAAASPRAPLAVKPLEDDTPTDNWLSSLAGPSNSTASSNGMKIAAVAATKGKAAKSGKHQTKQGQSGGGIAAALAAVSTFCRGILGWFNTEKRRLLGAVTGAALLTMLAGLASLPFLLSHPKPTHVAQSQTTEEPKVTPVESLVQPSPDKSADKITENKSETSETVPPKPDKHQADKEAPQPKSEKSENPKALKPSTQAAPKVVAAKPAEPGKSVPKPNVKPEVKPSTKAEVAFVPKPSAKPAPPKAAKTVSLDGLEKAVDLPPPGKGDNAAVSLGKLDLDPMPKLDVQLLGGNIVAKGRTKFELQKDGDDATPSWSIQMSGQTKDAVKIVRLWREGSEWKIQWATEAKDKGTLDKATLVRYCGLQFSSANAKPQLVALSKPKTVPPLAIDFDQVAAKKPLPWGFLLPAPSALRLQILPLDKSIPKNDMRVVEAKAHAGRSQHGKPTEATEPVVDNKVSAKGHLYLGLTKEKTPRVRFDIDFDARGKDVVVEMTAYCEINGNVMPCNTSYLQQFAFGVNRSLTTAQAASKSKTPPPTAAEQVKLCQKTQEQLKALYDLGGELNHKASIPFRVYVVLGDTDNEATNVVLFQSGQSDEPQAAGTKKPLKAKQQRGRAASEKKDEFDLK